MKKAIPVTLVALAAILMLSIALPAKATVTIKTTVDDSLFVTYDLNLDPDLYQQTKTSGQFNFTTIPQIIMKNLEQQDKKLVTWFPGPEASNNYDDANNTIHVSFFLGGSDIISFKVNGTTMKRAYHLNTDWRKFQINLTNNFSIDFGQQLATPVSEWQKTNTTTFYYKNNQTDTSDIFFYLVLPASASRIRAEGDTIFYDMPPRIEDQLLNSPFLILGALAVALTLVLIYRKVR